jgi:hypothetical protein
MNAAVNPLGGGGPAKLGVYGGFAKKARAESIFIIAGILSVNDYKPQSISIGSNSNINKPKVKNNPVR